MWQRTKTVVFALLLVLSIGLVAGLAIVQLRGGKLLSVQSGSMVPQINKGDLVVATSIPSSQLAVGDVVTFTNPHNKKQTITHRIVAVSEMAITTKGDANVVADTPISKGLVIGRVQRNIPFLGYAFDFVRKPLGLILLIYIPALAIIADEIKRLSKYYKSKEPRVTFGGSLPPKHKQTRVETITLAGKVLAVFVVIGVLVAVPTYAALSTQATLTGNTISTAPASPTSPFKMLIREVRLQCSADNTVTSSKRPKIVLLNPNREEVVANGWHIADNSGNFITIPDGTRFRRNHNYDFTPLLSDGLQYAGDRVVLLDGNNLLIDGLSWGADTSQLNPALPAVDSGTKIKRHDAKVDTNTAADWRINDRTCKHEDNDNEHETGDDDDYGDMSEVDRTHVVGTFHMHEEDED